MKSKTHILNLLFSFIPCLLSFILFYMFACKFALFRSVKHQKKDVARREYAYETVFSCFKICEFCYEIHISDFITFDFNLSIIKLSISYYVGETTRINILVHHCLIFVRQKYHIVFNERVNWF